MAWVSANALSVGDVISGERKPNVQPIYYHHPFLIVGIGGGALSMRNCTSHLNDDFTTIEITDGDKLGGPHWKTGRSSYLVTSGDATMVATAVVSGYTTQGTGTVQVEVASGPPLLQTYTGQDGQPFYAYYQPTRVVTQPRIVALYSNVEFSYTGSITTTARDAILQAL